MHDFAWPMRTVSKLEWKPPACGFFKCGGNLLEGSALLSTYCVDSGCGFGKAERKGGRVQESTADIVDVDEVDELISGRHAQGLAGLQRIKQ